MQKPNSIRTATMFLYINLAFSLLVLFLNVRLLLSPPPDQREKIEALTSGQLTAAFINMLMPIAASVLALYFIRKKRRVPAIVAALGVLYFSSANIYQMAIGFVIVLMLFLRSSREYFAGGVQPKIANVQEADPSEASADAESPEPSGSADSAPVAAVPAPRAARAEPVVEIRPAGPEDAATVHSLMIAAFEDYRTSVPPSSALEETADSVREALESGQGAAILYEDDKPAAMVRYEISGETITFFRLSVIPSRRRRGYARRLIKWIEHLGVSKGMNLARCKVRQSVQNNVAMYQDMGYEIIDQELVVRPAGTVKAVVLEKQLGV